MKLTCRRNSIFVLKQAVLAVFCAIWLIPALAMAEPVVKNLSVDRDGEVEVITLTTSEAVSYDHFLLDNPNRLVIDFPALQWKTLQGLPLGYQGLALKNIRVGRFNPTTSRVVLDVKHPVKLLGVNVKNRGNAGFEMEFEIGKEGASRDRVGSYLPPKQQRSTSGADYVAEHFTPPSTSQVIDEVPVPTASPRAPTRAEKGLPKQMEAPIPVIGKDWTELVKDEPIREGKVLSYPELAARGFTMTPVPVMKSLGAGDGGVKRKPMIVIDAGHGGKDPGATGFSGLKEKVVTLEYARALRDALKGSGRYEVTLTRGDDRYIMLRERLAIGRRSKGDLFISLHADSAENHSTRGLSLYTLSDTASDKEAAALAQRENKVDLIFGMDLTHEDADVAEILVDLAQRETNNKSEKLASHLIKALKQHTNLLQNAHRHAGFAVLKAPDVPSVLIEIGFLSNRKDEALIKSRTYRDKLTRGIVQGVDSYFTAQKFW